MEMEEHMIPPLSYILIPTVIAFFGAILGTLLTIFLTPRLQHRFWKYQRREELRLAAINEINRLIAEFSIHYLWGEIGPDPPNLSPAFFQSWEMVKPQIKVLFSDSTYQAFDRMRLTYLTASLYSNQEVSERATRVEKLARTQEAALRALYREIGIIKKERRFLRRRRLSTT